MAPARATTPPPLPLGFTIDETEGYAGDTVHGHVNTADVAANCNTTEPDVQAAFAPIANIDNDTGEVTGLMADPDFQHMFFPTDFDLVQWVNDTTYYWDTYEHVAYGMIELVSGFTANGFVTSFTLPKLFIQAFVNLVTQRPVGTPGSFDYTTGDGSVIVPDLPSGLNAVVAACVIPDPDRVALAVEAAAQFLQDFGVPINPPDPNYDYFSVLFDHGQDLLAEMMVPKAVGLQFYTVDVQVCGDGIVERGEECDGGDAGACGGFCTTACTCPVCGNSVLEPGEQCDDGNTVDDDGCTNGCRLPACGDDIQQAGEQCDDGNTVDGDCCSSTCQFESAGSPCAADTDVCTGDTCDGAGSCTHPLVCTDQPIAAVKLILRRGGSGAENAIFVSKDPNTIFPTPGGPDDPRTAGATLEILSEGEGTATFDLPATNWTANGAQTVYKFKNPSAPSGPSVVKVTVLKEAKVLKVVAKKTGLPLVDPLVRAGARFRTGLARSCAVFEPATVKKDDPNKFIAKNATAPAVSDCSDASLGFAGSPSGAFLDVVTD